MKKPKTKITNIGELEDLMPKHSYSGGGDPMEPVNLVVIGNRRFLDRHFKRYGWCRADKIGAVSLSKALVAAIFNRSYRHGPMASSYVSGRHFELAYQKPTRSDTYRRRHHLRLWRTPYKYFGRRIWAGTVSYDRSVGLGDDDQPTHHIAPTLSWEENFLAQSLGLSKNEHLTLGRPYKGQLNNGDSYDYDGRALVLDLSHSPSGN